MIGENNFCLSWWRLSWLFRPQLRSNNRPRISLQLKIISKEAAVVKVRSGSLSSKPQRSSQSLTQPRKAWRRGSENNRFGGKCPRVAWWSFNYGPVWGQQVEDCIPGPQGRVIFNFRFVVRGSSWLVFTQRSCQQVLQIKLHHEGGKGRQKRH